MVFRYDLRPVTPPAGEAPLEKNSGLRRLERLKKLSGRALAETYSAQRLCRELWESFPRAWEDGGDFVLEEDEQGKPFLLGSRLHVSLSHSGGYAAATIADVPLGLDLQSLRDISPRVLKRLYSREENAWIKLAEGAEGQKRAVRLWTMKEAYGKLLGRGIFTGPAFCAAFCGGRLQRKYPDCRFLFPAAPEGLLLTVCLGYGQEGSPAD